MDYDWRKSHRMRLAFMGQKKLDGRKEQRIWVEGSQKGDWRLEGFDGEILRERYLDIGLTGKPHQVS